MPSPFPYLVPEGQEYTFRGYRIPDYMMAGLYRWIEKGIYPGQFLRAVLANDLREAVDHADDLNINNLPAYVAYLVNKAPAGSWGSREICKTWHDAGGLKGIIEEAHRDHSSSH